MDPAFYNFPLLVTLHRKLKKRLKILNFLFQAVIRQKPGVGIRSKASEDLNMTKVHQDDDYIYPSLELSDDEMEVGSFMAAAKDDAWTPKVKVSVNILAGV